MARTRYWSRNLTGLAATYTNPSANLPGTSKPPTGCPECKPEIPWWAVVLSALAVVETAVVLLTRK